MPRRRVKHHPNRSLARLRAVLAACKVLRRPLAHGPFRSIPFAGGCAGLPSGDAASNAPNLLNIVDPVGLFLEEKLVQVSAEG
jgi:hypothetical protein